jgi:pimeloyl-ACP methyl ester carboxylesterase
MSDIVDLLAIYANEQGAPSKVYLTGASEGGIITALLAEQYPDQIDGGVAACGPVGDFAFQINYFGDARATFEYFFPDLIPGEPFDPAPEVETNWREYFDDIVAPTIFAPENAATLEEWVTVARLAVDPDDWQASVEQSAYDVLRYAIVNLRDATQTLGGFPFENRRRIYLGSSNDIRLNIFVPRVSADTVALHEMDEHYDTVGALEIPLITLHTRRDQQIPYLHETLYTIKNLREGSFISQRLNIPINRYGHCNFTEEEAIFAFAVMLIYAGDGELIPELLDLLSGEQVQRLEAIASRRR